jgi:hypothetical protein
VTEEHCLSHRGLSSSYHAVARGMAASGGLRGGNLAFNTFPPLGASPSVTLCQLITRDQGFTTTRRQVKSLGITRGRSSFSQPPLPAPAQPSSWPHLEPSSQIRFLNNIAPSCTLQGCPRKAQRASPGWAMRPPTAILSVANDLVAHIKAVHQ